MDGVNLGHSSKNIPIHNRKEIRINLVHKSRKFLENLRWKAFFYLNPSKKPKNRNFYGFKTPKSAPIVPELKEFQEGLISLVENVQFKNKSRSSTNFQQKLSQDVKKIRESDKVLLKADKTSNFYKLDTPQYKEILRNSINSEYKKATLQKEQSVIDGEKRLASSLGISDRVEVMAKSEAYVTLKDHKPDFVNSPSYRLLNPNKGNMGKVSKDILQSMNDRLRELTKYSQWKSSAEVIKWFDEIKNKERASFIQFDIDKFYPSISEDLLNTALDWASELVEISVQQRHIISSTKQNLLCENGSP